MKIRLPLLPNGWYPSDKNGVETFCNALRFPQDALAAIAPHAGWYYSGHLAVRAVSSLISTEPSAAGPQTIAILGGHVPAGFPPLIADEDAAQGPLGLGLMHMDDELRAALANKIKAISDVYRDNTVEVLLPMVHYFFPHARLLMVRLPNQDISYSIGKELAVLAKSQGRTLKVLASTDLTHYGTNYDFVPAGLGTAALDFAAQNDQAFIDAVLSEDRTLVLELAKRKQAACSVGAVLGFLGFIHEMGLHPTLIEKGNSIQPGQTPDSFVGYAAFMAK
ncbi:AmmeMemoRadiSam system protein B [Breznakiellaceae bacterium SP9]